MVRPPIPPVYLLLLESTLATIDSNVLETSVSGIRYSTDTIQNEGCTRVVFMRLEFAALFYSLLPAEDSKPYEFIVLIISGTFLPKPDESFLQITDCHPYFEKALLSSRAAVLCQMA